MTVDYASIADEVAVAMAEVAQGTVTLTRPGTETPGANPWDPPVFSDPVTYTLDATVKGVSARYVDGTTILATDLEIMASIMATDESGAQVSLEPDFGTDTLSIDGKVVSLVRDLSFPAAGERVLLKLIVRG